MGTNGFGLQVEIWRENLWEYLLGAWRPSQHYLLLGTFPQSVNPGLLFPKARHREKLAQICTKEYSAGIHVYGNTASVEDLPGENNICILCPDEIEFSEELFLVLRLETKQLLYPVPVTVGLQLRIVGKTYTCSLSSLVIKEWVMVMPVAFFCGNF